MKTLAGSSGFFQNISTFLTGTSIAACLLLYGANASAQPLPPGSGSPHLPLDAWYFESTNWLSSHRYAPVSFTNLVNVVTTPGNGDGNALLLDSTNAAWLQYDALESDGHANITVDQGSVSFWFSPDWTGTDQGGTGPGQLGRLIEVGSYTTNAAWGWWSLYIDAGGTNIYFSAQTNGAGTDYLSAPISWTSNVWHNIVLTYSSTNSILYIDGVQATNGAGLSYWPGPDVLTNGFFIGSDSNGVLQARGMFDDLYAYNYQLDAGTIEGNFAMYTIVFYPYSAFASYIVSAPSAPSIAPSFNAITGIGYLQPTSTNASGCVTSSSTWLTNIVATITNGGVMVTFTIGGGSNGVPYDVFANSVLDFSSNSNLAWAWMGQGYQCVTYSLTNLPNTACFLILGTPLDTDQDGLTDAYELLVSKTNPNKSDSSGDGMLDGWKVLWGLNPLINNTAQPGQRSNYGYNLTDWLNQISGVRSGAVGLDAEGNVQSASQ